MPNYALPASIESELDAEQFFKYLVKVDELNFHPDTEFCDYGIFTDEEIAVRENLMNQCFDLLDERVYEVAHEVLNAEMP